MSNFILKPSFLAKTSNLDIAGPQSATYAMHCPEVRLNQIFVVQNLLKRTNIKITKPTSLLLLAFSGWYAKYARLGAGKVQVI